MLRHRRHCQFNRIPLLHSTSLKLDSLFPVEHHRSREIMHFPERQMSSLQSSVQEMSRFLPHSASASVFSRLQKLQGTSHEGRISFVHFLITPNVSDSRPSPLFPHLYERSWKTTCGVPLHCPRFGEDATGSADLHTGRCYEEFTKVHSSGG